MHKISKIKLEDLKFGQMWEGPIAKIHKIKIGIDPPHGLAASENGVLFNCFTFTGLQHIFTAIKMLADFNEILEVVVEQPHGLGTKLGKGMPINVQRKISANIGGVMADAKAIEAFCKAMNIPVRMALSNKALTKWKADKFRQLTGWKGRTSEHARDAAMLIFEKKA